MSRLEINLAKVDQLELITLKKHHPRTNRYGGNISIFMQRMEVPPLDE